MVGIGVIGVWYWGKNHVRVLKELELEGSIDFVECVTTNSKPLSDGLVGLRAIEMAEAALKSAKLKKAVKIKKL